MNELTLSGVQKTFSVQPLVRVEERGGGWKRKKPRSYAAECSLPYKRENENRKQRR